MADKPKLEVVSGEEEKDEAVSIPKPAGGFSLDKFKSKRAVALAGVETMQTALPHFPIKEARDFVRLHPDVDNYWSPELCFVNVPIKGQKRNTLHLIDEELAMAYLPSARILRFRLVLASKPDDVFFLAEVPTRNLDDTWVASHLDGCEQAKGLWTQITSRRDEGVEAYKVDLAGDRDAFPEPNWPKQSLADLIGKTFAGRTIETADHPALARLLGKKIKMT